MNPRRQTEDYFRDMLDAMEKVEQFTGGMVVAQFKRDDKTIFAVVRALEILGEASKKIPKSVRTRYSRIPWRELAGIRNKLIHEYFGVNIDVI